MSDMLSIGSSALLAYRTALDTVSHNISNANTPGYTRQRADLVDMPGTLVSGNYVGMGVDVQTIQRISSSLLQTQLMSDDSSYSRLNTLSTYSSQIDSWLSDANSGLAQPMQAFFDSLNTLASNPSSTAARQTLLGSAQTLASTFSGLQGQFNGLDTQLKSQVSSTVDEINSYTSQIAQLNLRIQQATGLGNGQVPNDLVDQREQLLRNLAGDVGITTTTGSNGSINVFTGSGQALVLETTATTMAVQSDQFGQDQDIVLKSGAAPASIITQQLSGGTLGGLLDFRREVMEPAVDQLGRVSLALTDAVNTQHAQGMDQYGQLGGAFFTAPVVNVNGSSANSGTEAVSVTVADPNQLGATDYVLSYNGAAWQLTDRQTGTQVALSGAGTVASPLTGAGLQIVISGAAPVSGDKFLVQPTRYAAGEIGVAITDPARIAAASPVQTKSASTNSGAATISGAQVLDVTNPNLLTNATIQFTSATTYSINGVGSYAYTSGGNIDFNGWRVQVSGTPAVGDTFTVSANNGSSTDNSNLKLMSGIATQKLLNGGVNTLSAANAAMVSGVGSQSQQVTAQLNAQTAIRNQAQSMRDSISGVNLDEEAADMMRFQQAYQAAAQIISTSNTLFASLISAIGR